MGRSWAKSCTLLSANGPFVGHRFDLIVLENFIASYILVIFNVKTILFQQDLFCQDSFHEMH